MINEAERLTPLLEQVKQTVTLDGGVPIYEQAEVEIVQFYPDEVYPTALYVLNPNLQRLRTLSLEVDIFNLTEILEHRDGIVIAPPVVELSDGVPAIVDGAHRFYLARMLGVTINAIYVRNTNPEYPLISYPVTWGEVTAYDVKPEDPRLLRRLREGLPDQSQYLRAYYRDLSYLGSAGRRPRKGQNG